MLMLSFQVFKMKFRSNHQKQITNLSPAGETCTSTLHHLSRPPRKQTRSIPVCWRGREYSLVLIDSLSWYLTLICTTCSLLMGILWWGKKEFLSHIIFPVHVYNGIVPAHHKKLLETACAMQRYTLVDTSGSGWCFFFFFFLVCLWFLQGMC